MSGPKRLPPRLHPDDFAALTAKLEAVATSIEGRVEAELEKRTRYLRAELEKLEMRTRSRGVLVPVSTHRILEERVVRLEDELRDITRSSLKTFLELSDIEDRAEALVQELREELTG